MSVLNLSIAALAAATLLAVAATPARAQEPVTLRTGAFAPPGSVFATYWARFKTNVERDSKGTIKVELNIGDPNEGNLLSNPRRGRVDCVGASLQGSATVLPGVAVLQLPYVFPSFRHVDHAYDAGLVEAYRKLFDAKGITMLSFVEVGFTHTYATMTVKSPADVKGVKMRATLARASQAWIKAARTEPVVLPIAEAVPGLQTGLIKGGESGIVVYSALIAKAAPQYLLTRHAFDSGTIMCNKAFFDKLTPEQQTAVRNCWSVKDQVRDTRASNEKFLTDAAGLGITVVRPNAAELAQWQAAGKKVAEELIAGFTPQGRRIYDDIQRDLATL